MGISSHPRKMQELSVELPTQTIPHCEPSKHFGKLVCEFEGVCVQPCKSLLIKVAVFAWFCALVSEIE
ncbi:hypothetical protein ACFX1R_019755 [Malus domestica]